MEYYDISITNFLWVRFAWICEFRKPYLHSSSKFTFSSKYGQTIGKDQIVNVRFRLL